MKKYLVAALAILCAVYMGMPSLPLLMTDEAITPWTLETKPNYDDDTNYSGFAGRLYIDDVGIDVALYRSNKQYVVDRDDSAAYFDLGRWPNHMLIADHNTEAFAPLCEVQVGTIAKIVKPDGTVAYFECYEVFDGHNTGKYITDWDGHNVVPNAELLMYTCFDGWKNVKVALWNEINIIHYTNEKEIEKVLTQTNDLIDKLLDEMLEMN